MNITNNMLQSVTFKDFEESLSQVKPTVSRDDLDQYYKWNTEFGSDYISLTEFDN